MPETHLKIALYGKTYVPEKWTFGNNPSINKLYYIYDGTGHLNYFQNGELNRFPLKKGHLYLLPSHIYYTPEHDSCDPIDHLFFNFNVIPPIMMETHLEVEISEISTLFYLIKACECFLTESAKEDNNSNSDHYRNLTTLFDTLFSHVCYEYKIPRVLDERINTVLKYIHNNYCENITLTMLADLIHLEQRHLLRIFKKSLRISPIRYLKDYRLNIAASLLKKGIALQDVVEQLRYENLSSFYYAFKKYHQLPPSAFMP